MFLPQTWKYIVSLICLVIAFKVWNRTIMKCGKQICGVEIMPWWWKSFLRDLSQMTWSKIWQILTPSLRPFQLLSTVPSSNNKGIYTFVSFWQPPSHLLADVICEWSLEREKLNKCAYLSTGKFHVKKLQKCKLLWLPVTRYDKERNIVVTSSFEELNCQLRHNLQITG